jgi:hypothetical protein
MANFSQTKFDSNGQDESLLAHIIPLPRKEPNPPFPWTLFIGDEVVTKQYRFEDGRIKSEAAKPMARGTAILMVSTSLRGFAETIGSLDPFSAIGSGIPKILADSEPGSSIAIVTKNRLNGGEAIARTKDHFTFPSGPGLFWLDLDKMQNGTVYSPEQVHAVLCEVCPAWRVVECFYCDSGSAHITHTASGVTTGRSGMRVYAIIDDASNIPLVIAAFADLLWKAGHGWIKITETGSCLDRTLIDLSKTGTESLDYAGKPVLGEGLVKEYHPPIFKGPTGEILDSRAAIAESGLGKTGLADWRRQSKEVEAAKKASWSEAQKVRRACLDKKVDEYALKLKRRPTASEAGVERAKWERTFESGSLPEDFVIYLRDGRVVTVGEILDDVEKFDGEYCRDPFEPNYNDNPSVAQINAKDCPHIWSFAHGGKYHALERDFNETPLPIEAPLRSVPKFDAEEMLPEPCRAWIVDEAYRLHVPAEMVAVSALFAAGSLIGARVAMRPKRRDNFEVVVNLWGAIISPPAKRKSAAISSGLHHFSTLAKRARKKYEEEMKRFKVTSDCRNQQRKVLKKTMLEGTVSAGTEPTEEQIQQIIAIDDEEEAQTPKVRRYVTNDTTIEKLALLLVDNPGGLAVVHDELMGWLASMRKQGHERDRPFYIQAWEGKQPYNKDLVGGAEEISVKNLCASIFGGIQPDKFIAYIEEAESGGNDGMIQRFQLLVYPDSFEYKYRDVTPDYEAQKRAWTIFDELDGFNPLTWGATMPGEHERFAYFKFSEAAQIAYEDFCGDEPGKFFARKDREINPLIREHLDKYQSLLPSLALLFELIKIAENRVNGTRAEHDGMERTVGLDSLRMAIRWCEFLEQHARRVYGLAADDGLRSAKVLAKRLQDGRVDDGFTASEIKEREWTSLKTIEQVKAALDWLERSHWVRGEDAPSGVKGGCPTTRYRINPVIRS